MSILNVMLLTTAISVSSSANSKEQRAMEYTAKALYKYNRLDKIVKKVEDRIVPEWVKENPWIVYAIKIGSEKKISYQWSF